MLGIAVRKLVTLPVSSLGIICDLLEKISDPQWVEATKRFLRKENPWVKQWLWRKIDENTIEVNLDFPVKLPFEEAELRVWKKCSGLVIVKRIGEDLFIDDRKIILHFEIEQNSGTIPGSTLLTRLVEKDVLHPNILDALLENTHLIPNSFKKDKDGNIQIVFFWAVGFRDGNGVVCIRCLHFDDGRWGWDYGWLDNGFDDQCPAVLLAS